MVSHSSVTEYVHYMTLATVPRFYLQAQRWTFKQDMFMKMYYWLSYNNIVSRITFILS
jgi:hypothetical protein